MGQNQRFDVSFLDEMDAIAGIKPAAQQQPDFMAQMDAIAAKKQRPERSATRFIGEQLSKGLLSLGDLATMLGQANPNLATMPEEQVQEVRGNIPVEYPSEYVPALTGVNLNTEPEDTTARQIAGPGLRGAGAGIIGGPIGALMSGLAGATSGALKAAGAPGWAAEPVGIIGTAAAPRALKGIGRWATAKNPLSGKEKEVAKFLQTNIPEAERQAAIAKLEAARPYKKTRFESSTAGETGAPTLAHLHRLQLEAPGSELPGFAAKGTKKLTVGFKEQGPKGGQFKNNAAIRESIEKHLTKLRKQRHEATNPIYEALEQDERINSTTHLAEFFKKRRNVAGSLQSDLEAIKQSVKTPGKPDAKLAKELETWTKNDAEFKKFGPKIHGEWLADNPNPATQSTVARLTEADKALTDKIHELSEAKQFNRAKLHKQAQEAIEKDLKGVPEYKEVKNKYREMSKPISEIEKHPSLKGVVAKKEGHYLVGQKKVINEIFHDNKAYEHIESLKKSLGENHPIMEKVRKGAMRHLYNNITNASTQGGEHVLSLPKMNRFLNKHDEALRVFLTPEQKGFIREARRAMKTQHAEKAESVGVNSATAGRLKTSGHIEKEFKLENEPFWTTNLKAQGYRLGRSTPFVKEFFNDMAQRRAHEMSNILNKVLMDKEFAKRLMTHKFHGPEELSKFVNDAGRLSLSEFMAKEEGEE